MPDFSEFAPKPSKKQITLYHKWRTYLKDSKLSIDEQHKRAADFAGCNRTVPDAD